MQKQIVLIAALVCSGHTTWSTAPTPGLPEIDRGYVCHDARKTLPARRILTNKIITAVDSFINSTLFSKILILRQNLTNMLLGVLNNDTKTRVGLYTFAGKTYSIQQLAHYERMEAQTDDLTTCLEQSKDDFQRQTSEFLKLAKDFKSHMIILIDESLRLHKRKTSILLSWAEAEEGHEMQAFKSRVISFNAFAHFLDDLLNYLDDLIASCPKAQKAFLQTKTDREQTIYAQRFKGIYERQKYKIDNVK